MIALTNILSDIRLIQIVLAILFFTHSQAQIPEENPRYVQAALYAENQEYKKALEQINLAISEDPQPEYFLKKYNYLVMLKEIGESLETLNLGIKTHPTSVKLLHHRAQHYYVAKEFEKTEKDYEKILNLVPDGSNQSLEYMLKYAQIKLAVRAFDEAVLIIRDILKIDSQNHEALALSAVLNIELREYEKAKQKFMYLLKKSPKKVSTIINLGYTFQKLNNHKDAIALFYRALEIDPQNPYALSNMAYSKFRLGSFDDALDDINKSLKYFVSNAYAYWIRAEIMLVMKKPVEACNDLWMAKQLRYDTEYGSRVNDLLQKYCQKMYNK